MRAYLIVLDEKKWLESFDEKAFHNKLTSAEGVQAWWHYMTNVYIIVVNDNVNATNVMSFIQAITGEKFFLVTHFDPDDHNGWLPQEAWNWINQNREHFKLR